MSSLTPSPSPPPNPQPENSSSSSNTTTWAFPGPSSRFHTRERIRPRREVKSTYIPVAPNLSTAQRAQHKRAQSAQAVPLAKRSRGSGGGESAGGFPGPPSPPASETAGRSPFLSRLSSWTGGESPSLRRNRRTSLVMSNAGGLMTPARRSGGDWDKRLQDSPFSDYFTDDARSVDTSAGKSSRHSGAGAWLSEEGQDVLARLGRLQTRVMRAEEGEQEGIRRIVERKVQEVEQELEDWYHRPGSAELEDSGFIDEEREEMGGASDDGVQGLGLHGVSERPEREDVEQEDASSQGVDSESDHQLSEARQILENVTKAQEELRKRHAELVLLNEQHLEQLEDNETEIETLRSENEGLRSDLGFDHSELLFLKLQMKAIEVEVEDLDKPASRPQKLSDYARHGGKNVRRGQILQEMDQWRNDWQDVHGRLKRRLSRYGVLSADKRDHSLEKALQVRGEDLGDWQLETIRESSGGKVASLTIRRVERGEQVADGVVEVQAGLGKADEGQMVSHHAEQQLSLPAGAIEKGSQTEGQCSLNYVEQASQTDRIPPVPTVDQKIRTDTQNNGATSTSTDSIDLPSPSQSAPSYQNEATQTEISLANLLPPRYYAPDAYGIEESGGAVTELSLVVGGKDRDSSFAVGDEEEETDDEDEDEDAEEEVEEDEDDCAITTSPSSPTTNNTNNDDDDDDDDDSRTFTLPDESVKQDDVPSARHEQQQQQGKPKYKSAWAELWEGLGHLAGVGGDEDEDEDEEEE
ncbi:hypothetical protein KC318_g10279 [Hortaea werneckii]|uniref:Uncharacterized protein n=1 Tax=Hortaea werneckii TaxID=91943 RepID=A0A3M6YV28_HORWE|nr:hypothetical protein KC334_g6836 [Hortaea werneckii]KAI7660127.1 hypothetical protein KC318_g10279 [Hortaea werneckii]RMX91546.1 hypothetical protein D0867_14921 [Hortaea werneckii]RMY06757.1 hypothetical protein D0866_15009 [Hortaea werneckii]